MKDNLKALIQQAEDLFEKEQYDALIQLLPDVVLEEQKQIDLYFYRARAHFRKQENEQGFLYADKTIACDNEHWMSYFMIALADSYKDNQNLDQQIANYSKVIELKPDYAYAYNGRGNAWRSKSDYDKAILDYNKAIELKPDDAHAYNNRGNASYDKSDYDKAIIDYNRAIELKPDYANAYYNRGNAWYFKSDYDKAILDYNIAIELKPDDAITCNNRGIAWSNKSDYDKAILDYNKAIELKPDYVDAYNNRGLAWINKSDYDKAILDHNKAIELKPDYAIAYFARGIAWYSKSDYDMASLDYNKAIELKPDYNAPYYNIAQLYYKKAEYSNAEKNYKKYVELNASNPDYYTTLAQQRIEEISRLIADSEFKDISEIVGKIKKLLLYKDDLLTHYTTLSTAKALILDKSPFRLSEGSFLNDTSEGSELLDFLGISFSGVKEKGKAQAEVFAQKPFIGSFVTDSKYDDLTLWRMYGKEEKDEAKGCAITIDMNKLIELINDKLMPDKSSGPARNDEDINFYRVAYLQKDEKKRFVIPGLKKAESKLNTLMNELAQKVKPYWDKTKKKKDIEELLNTIVYLFKSSIYMHENELRLVVKGIGFDKNIPSPPRVYIELVNIKNIIRKITLGPKVDKPDEWAAAFYYSYDKEPGKPPEVMISHLPFK